MKQRERDEQETRNAVAIMAWIEHLAVHLEVAINLDVICHINRLTLRNTDKDHWAGRVRSEVDWHQPGEWSRLRAIVAAEPERGLVVIDEHTSEMLVQFPPDREVGPMLQMLLRSQN